MKPHLAVILGQEEDKAIVAALVANTPLVVQGLCKVLSLLRLASAILKLHAVNKSNCNLQNQQQWISYTCSNLELCEEIMHSIEWVCCTIRGSLRSVF